MRWPKKIAWWGCSLAVTLAISGCGSATKSEPGTTAAAAEPCSSKIQDDRPGNVDRFSFTTDTADGSFVGFKDGKGNVVIEPIFGFAYEFSKEGVSAAVIRPSATNTEARAVFIDPSGKEIAQALFFDNGPDYFQSGYARIVNADGLVGFMSETGKIAITPQFDEAQGFCNGVALVRDKTSEWQVDETGKRVSEKTPYVAEPEGLD